MQERPMQSLFESDALFARRRTGACAPSQAQLAGKRMLDIGIALVLLMPALPVMLGAALLILVLDRQMPLYWGARVGLKGCLFPCFKLRTMRDDARILSEYLAAHPDEAERFRLSSKPLRDPRKTWLGGLLRCSSLDELPQLFNVLWGNMSIVGPRPVPESEYRERLPHSLQTVRVKPGLTGLWQITGRSELSPEEGEQINLFYVENWTLALDLLIMLRTPAAVLRGRGAR